MAATTNGIILKLVHYDSKTHFFFKVLVRLFGDPLVYLRLSFVESFEIEKNAPPNTFFRLLFPRTPCCLESINISLKPPTWKRKQFSFAGSV